jgi:hypothetical protein
VEGETTYTVDEAAAVLGMSPERVREMLVTGELEGIPPGATLSGEWKVLLPASLGDGEGLNREVPADESAESTPEDQDKAPPVEGGAEEFVEPPQSSVGTKELPATSEEPKTNVSHETSDEADAELRGEEGASSWTTTKQATKFAGASAETEQMTYVYADTGEALRYAIERVEARTAEATELRVRLEIAETAQSTLRAELAEEQRRREAAERERDALRRQLEARREPPPGPRELPVAPASTQTLAAGVGGGGHHAREATHSAAEALRGPPEPRPLAASSKSLQSPAQPGLRSRLWRRVFGR